MGKFDLSLFTGLLMLTLSCHQPEPVSLEEEKKPDIQIIFEATNKQRERYKLTPYVMNLKLRRAAQRQADNMARMNMMSHIMPIPGEGTPSARAKNEGYESGFLGENIAMGASAETVVRLWMSSPGHRAAILSRSYDEIGIGIAYSNRNIPYGCQVFGKSVR